MHSIKHISVIKIKPNEIHPLIQIHHNKIMFPFYKGKHPHVKVGFLDLMSNNIYYIFCLGATCKESTQNCISASLEY